MSGRLVRMSLLVSTFSLARMLRTKNGASFTMDLENAFNQIDQSCISGKSDEWHQAWPGTVTCATQTTFGLEKNPSNRWVQHGDPSGPLLFVLGHDGAISEGRTQVESIDDPLDLTASFLVDGTARGSHEATQAFLSGFQKKTRRQRPQIEPHKVCLIRPYALDLHFDTSRF